VDPSELNIRKILEDPVVFEHVEDNRKQLSGGCDDRLTCTALFLDVAIETVDISRVADGD